MKPAVLLSILALMALAVIAQSQIPQGLPAAAHTWLRYLEMSGRAPEELILLHPSQLPPGVECSWDKTTTDSGEVIYLPVCVWSIDQWAPPCGGSATH